MGRTRRRRYELDDAELNRQIEDLVAEARRRQPEEADPSEASVDEYVRQLVVTALRLLRERAPGGDVRLLNSALKELRHSLRVFEPYAHVRKVAVFGSARTTPEEPDWQQAHAFAERIVRQGWMVITGAGGGIMNAAQGGAGRDASFGVNIRLPFEQAANEVIAGDRKLINFRYFFTRKVTFVKEAHAIALFPGGFGTHDEGFEALTLIQTGKSEILPVVFVDAPGGSYWRDWEVYLHDHLRARGLIGEDDLSLFRITDDVDEAIAEILSFYRNYHSSRFVGDRLVLRMWRAPTAEQLDELNRDFADLLTEGRIEISDALACRTDEAPDLPRITLQFDRRRAGRLRALIDRLNAFVPERRKPLAASPHQIVEQKLPDEAARAEESQGPPRPDQAARAATRRR